KLLLDLFLRPVSDEGQLCAPVPIGKDPHVPSYRVTDRRGALSCERVFYTIKGAMNEFLQDFLTKYRAYVLTGIGLPAGMLLDTAMRVRNFLYERLGSAPQDHDLRVEHVQAQVRRWNAQPETDKRPMCTDRKTWMNLSTRFEPKHLWHRIQM